MTLTVHNPGHSQSRSRGTDELANMKSDEKRTLFAEARASAGSGGGLSAVVRGSRWLLVEYWRKGTTMTGGNKSWGDVEVPTDQFAMPFLMLTRHNVVNEALIEL